MNRCPNFQCHLDHECFHDNGYSTKGYHSKGYLFEIDGRKEVIIGSSNITRYALLKNMVKISSTIYPRQEYVEIYRKKYERYKDILNRLTN